MNLDKVNKYIKEFEKTITKPRTNFDKSKFFVGVDLGTANIMITILDKDGKPVAGATQRSRVVKDGIVVDFMGAISIVRKLKEELEEKLGIEITEGYTAIPPGVEQGSVKAIVNVVESAGIDVKKVVDEPTAASYVLGITDGVVVDLGGGTTGISILKDGKVVFVADETAEDIKTDKKREKEVCLQITPVLQKMASIVKKYISAYDVKDVYLVGGACSFEDSEKIFAKELGLNIHKPYMPLYITPIGIALAGLKD